MHDGSPISVGLGGDGDEIVAIDDVERTFGVKLDYADAPRSESARDLCASLQKVLSEEERARPDVWERFATALSGQTGVDPTETYSRTAHCYQSRDSGRASLMRRQLFGLQHSLAWASQ